MQIWVDADACPTVIKDIIFRAADRAKIKTTLVANQSLRVPPSKYISAVRVSSGFDVADNEIVRRCEQNDLVITADIPLAAEIIEKLHQYFPDWLTDSIGFYVAVDEAQSFGKTVWDYKRSSKAAAVFDHICADIAGKLDIE